MTIEEMKARYAPHGVLIGDPQTDEYQRVLAGKVLFHSPNREDVYQKAIELNLDDCAFRSLESYPAGMKFVL